MTTSTHLIFLILCKYRSDVVTMLWQRCSAWWDLNDSQWYVGMTFVTLNQFCKVYFCSFPLRVFSVNVTNPQETADLVIFTEEIINGKLHFLCSVCLQIYCNTIFVFQFSIAYFLKVSPDIKILNFHLICRIILSKVKQNNQT